MLKKAMLLAVTSALLAALAVPTVAQADTARYADNHSPVEMGAYVDAYSTEPFTMALWLGTAQCASVVYHGEVIENGSGTVELEEIKPATTVGCNFANTSIEFGNLTFQGDNYATASPVVVSISSPAHTSDPGTFYFTYEYGEDNLSLPINNKLYFPSLGGYIAFGGTFALEGVIPKPGVPVEIAEE